MTTPAGPAAPRHPSGGKATPPAVHARGAMLLAVAMAACIAGCDRGGGAAPPADSAPATTAQDAPLADAGAADAATGEATADDPAGTTPAEPEVPTLSIATIDGATWDLSQRRGRWVVVNFWATWCSPCLKEMPELSALDAMREDVEVVGLAYEDTTPEDLRAFLADHPVVYPVAIIDVTAPPADFATPRGLPMTYLIAPDGRVSKRFLGPVTAAEIEARIAETGGDAPKAAAGA